MFVSRSRFHLIRAKADSFATLADYLTFLKLSKLLPFLFFKKKKSMKGSFLFFHPSPKFVMAENEFLVLLVDDFRRLPLIVVSRGSE